MQKYIFKPYSQEAKELFKIESAKLIRLLPKKIKIEHIGSTSVPGLGGKGILDIIISTENKNINLIKRELQKRGYEFLPKAGDKNRLFFQGDFKYKGKTKRIHVHLTKQNSIIWKQCLALREYLKKYPKEIKRYEQIKKEAVKECKGIGKVYRDYKNDFLTNLTKKALKN